MLFVVVWMKVDFNLEELLILYFCTLCHVSLTLLMPDPDLSQNIVIQIFNTCIKSVTHS